MSGFLDWLQTYYGVVIAVVAVLEGIAGFIWLGIHGKKGHKLPDAQKLARKQAKKELRAQYKAAKKALCVPNEIVKEVKKDEKKK